MNTERSKTLFSTPTITSFTHGVSSEVRYITMVYFYHRRCGSQDC